MYFLFLSLSMNILQWFNIPRFPIYEIFFFSEINFQDTKKLSIFLFYKWNLCQTSVIKLNRSSQMIRRNCEKFLNKFDRCLPTSLLVCVHWLRVENGLHKSSGKRLMNDIYVCGAKIIPMKSEVLIRANKL